MTTLNRLTRDVTARLSSISESIVRDYVTMKVNAVADRLSITPVSVLKTYSHLFNPDEIAGELRQGQELDANADLGVDPIQLPIFAAGQLIRALAMAVRVVSLNHEQLRSGDLNAHWNLVGVLDKASEALSLLGLAIREAEDGAEAVTLTPMCVVRTRAVLSECISKLDSSEWTLHEDVPGLTAKTIGRLTEDLALVAE
jgi:hypothetical protein